MVFPEKEEKERFFDDLYHLDTLTSDDDKQPIRQMKHNLSSPVKRKRSPSRGFSDTDHASSALNSRPPVVMSRSRTVPEESDTAEHASMRRTISEKPPPRLAKRSSTAGGKSKGIKLLPENDRIFRDCVIYFIPNDDVAKPRKLRIQKALERGATWAKSWTIGVTHIVVDSDLHLRDVLKALSRDKPTGIETQSSQPSLMLSQGGVALVKDTWLTECFGARVLLDVLRSRFRVQGHVLGMEPRPSGPEPKQQRKSAVVVQDCPRDEVDTATITSLHDAERPLKGDLGTEISGPEARSLDHGPPDDLDVIINEMKQIEHLPIDTDDKSCAELMDGAVSEPFDSSQDQEVQPEEPDKQTKTNQGFSCMEKHDGVNKASNPNARTMEILQEMAKYYDRVGDHWRTTSYRKAMAALRKQDRRITTKEEALRIYGIGERLAAKIEEIVQTDALRRLQSTRMDANDKVLQLFMGIYHVGYPLASKWIAQGYRTLDGLKSKTDLTTNQEIGIEHYHDFQQRIARDEVAQHASIVDRALKAADSGLQMIVGGSYRRGAIACGDIDLIITKKEATLDHIRTLIRRTVLPKLEQDGFLKHTLAGGSDESSKWHGACALPGSRIWRRIDLLYVPWNELGAALIYFTGNDLFNRSIRLLARRKGMKLNQHGLYADVMRGQKGERTADGRLLEAASEVRIFEILGVPWRPPEHRICG